MKRMLIILTMLCISWPLIGCSGMPVKKTTTMEKPGQPDLWQQVENASSLTAMNKLFEQLWNNNDEFRGLINNHGQNNENDRRQLAAAYCLVTADPAQPWRRTLAARLYRNGLNTLPPARLDNDQQRRLFAAALARDGRATSPGAASSPAARQTKHTCRPAASPAAAPAARTANTKMHKQYSRCLFFDIQVIRGIQKKGETSRKLTGFAASMRDTLHFSSYVLVEEKSLLLGVGETGEIFLAPDRRLLLTPTKRKRDTAVLQTVISKNHEEVFRTLVETRDGGTVTIAGPKNDDSQVLLHITTRLQGTKPL